MSQSKILVITGVTKGMGKAMARVFLSQGHTVIGCGRSKDLLDSMKEEFHADAERCHLSVVDVSDDEQVKSWSIEALKYGSPDIVINNAAVIHSFVPTWEIPLQEFNALIDTGVKGYASVMRYFLPHMIKSGHGVLINMSSVSGKQAMKNFAGNTAAKFAIEGMTKAVALELPEPLTSVSLDPGVVGTSVVMNVFPVEMITKLTPPDVWAEKVCPFILTIDRSMNGKTLIVPEILDIKCGCALKDGEILFQGVHY